jgi:hypothetical protein
MIIVKFLYRNQDNCPWLESESYLPFDTLDDLKIAAAEYFSKNKEESMRMVNRWHIHGEDEAVLYPCIDLWQGSDPNIEKLGDYLDAWIDNTSI